MRDPGSGGRESPVHQGPPTQAGQGTAVLGRIRAVQGARPAPGLLSRSGPAGRAILNGSEPVQKCRGLLPAGPVRRTRKYRARGRLRCGRGRPCSRQRLASTSLTARDPLAALAPANRLT